MPKYKLISIFKTPRGEVRLEQYGYMYLITDNRYKPVTYGKLSTAKKVFEDRAFTLKDSDIKRS